MSTTVTILQLAYENHVSPQGTFSWAKKVLFQPWIQQSIEIIIFILRKRRNVYLLTLQRNVEHFSLTEIFKTTKSHDFHWAAKFNVLAWTCVIGHLQYDISTWQIHFTFWQFRLPVGLVTISCLQFYLNTRIMCKEKLETSNRVLTAPAGGTQPTGETTEHTSRWQFIFLNKHCSTKIK